VLIFRLRAACAEASKIALPSPLVYGWRGICEDPTLEKASSTSGQITAELTGATSVPWS
jgi:hypothetical protein